LSVEICYLSTQYLVSNTELSDLEKWWVLKEKNQMLVLSSHKHICCKIHVIRHQCFKSLVCAFKLVKCVVHARACCVLMVKKLKQMYS